MYQRGGGNPIMSLLENFLIELQKAIIVWKWDLSIGEKDVSHSVNLYQGNVDRTGV